MDTYFFDQKCKFFFCSTRISKIHFFFKKLWTPISFIMGMSTSFLGLKNQFAFGNAEICYFPFFHWRLEAKKFRFSRSCFTILNIYEDQNDYQLKQKNGLDFSNFAPTSIINSNSYTVWQKMKVFLLHIFHTSIPEKKDRQDEALHFFSIFTYFFCATFYFFLILIKWCPDVWNPNLFPL